MTKKKASGTPPLAPDWLPAWVKIETWIAFREHRIKIKKPMTEYAEKRVLIRLDALRLRGHEPNSLLDYAIEMGYQTVYEPKRVVPRQQSFAEATSDFKAQRFAAMVGRADPFRDDDIIDMEPGHARIRTH
jgi:hypothetical protein